MVGRFASNRSGVDKLAAVAKDFDAWRPAREVLRNVEAVPTRFIQFDAATGVGGFPIARVALLFGPSSQGKTEYALGVGSSFVERGHFFGLIDAERTTPPEWIGKLGLRDQPNFVALPVTTYEAAVGAVRNFCETIAENREKRRIPQDTSGIVVIDSIRKLVPKDLFAKIQREFGSGKFGRNGIDGVGGRAAQMKAALNSAWMDELVPLLAETRCAVLILAREDIDPDDEYAERPKVGGGRALYYDSSMAIRSTSSPLFLEGSDDKKHFSGERHTLSIRKTKVGKKIQKFPYANYFTSNGAQAPEGFWPERDLYEIALECGIITLRGSWGTFDGSRIGNGLVGILKRLSEDRELFARIEKAVRDTFKPAASSPDAAASDR